MYVYVCLYIGLPWDKRLLKLSAVPGDENLETGKGSWGQI